MEAIEGLSFIDTKLRTNAPFMTAVPGGLWHGSKEDLPVGVFPDQIFCVYQHLSGVDDRGGGGIKIGTKDLYIAKIIGPASNITGIETAFDLMDGLIDNSVGATGAATVYYFLRQQAFVLPQNINARLVLNAVAQYRTFLQKIGS